MTREKRYDKLNTPLRLKKDIETEKKKKSEKKLKKDVDKAKTRW